MKKMKNLLILLALPIAVFIGFYNYYKSGKITDALLYFSFIFLFLTIAFYIIIRKKDLKIERNSLIKNNYYIEDFDYFSIKEQARELSKDYSEQKTFYEKAIEQSLDLKHLKTYFKPLRKFLLGEIALIGFADRFRLTHDQFTEVNYIIPDIDSLITKYKKEPLGFFEEMERKAKQYDNPSLKFIFLKNAQQQWQAKVSYFKRRFSVTEIAFNKALKILNEKIERTRHHSNTNQTNNSLDTENTKNDPIKLPWEGSYELLVEKFKSVEGKFLLGDFIEQKDRWIRGKFYIEGEKDIFDYISDKIKWAGDLDSIADFFRKLHDDERELIPQNKRLLASWISKNFLCKIDGVMTEINPGTLQGKLSK
jgi:hypothetical protein